MQSNDETGEFLKSLGFPQLNIHTMSRHHDFISAGKRILVIGPMGSGKTEFSARVCADSRVALKKKGAAARLTSSGNVDRRDIFIVRSALDKSRFRITPRMPSHTAGATSAAGTGSGRQRILSASRCSSPKTRQWAPGLSMRPPFLTNASRIL
jgi:hypothetical protein